MCVVVFLLMSSLSSNRSSEMNFQFKKEEKAERSKVR